MENIRLTIITPVFNGSRYILNCLENVAGQVVPGIEHLIMDGASTDRTAEIAMEFAGKYPHVRVVSEKDKGQSDAMNKGIALARGPVIGFLNADDFYEPGVIPRILEIFRDLPEPSFVCGNLNILEADHRLRHFNRPDRISITELVSNCFEWPYNPSAYFYHKSLHRKTGPYNVENNFCMDYEFILAAARVTTLIHTDEVWGNFVIAEDSKTSESHREEWLKKSFDAGQAVRDRIRATFSPEEESELEKILSENAPLLLPEKPSPPPGLVRRIRQKIRSLIDISFGV